MAIQARSQPRKQDTSDSQDDDDPAPTSASATLKWAIDQARRDLLDPSRRNRLLHAPLTGKRPWCMAIVGHDPDDLLQSLTRRDKFGGYAFRAVPEDQGGFTAESANPELLKVSEASPRAARSRSPTAAAGSAAPNGRPRLQTKLDAEKLERRLTKIFREERTLEEEQGVSTLYLALGFLKWFDSDQSEEASFAPLILLPVTIARVRGPDGYHLLARDEEIVTNVSLREKLHSEFSVSLPDIPENDQWLPSTYCDSVAREITRYKRWEVKADDVGLGFFTFSKFMMWRDLDASGWPDNKLIKHPLLDTLLGDSSEFQDRGPLVSDDEPIDGHIDISKAIHVVDADSSQAIVVAEALQGRNLVVQGPPGTGKSQTITNIIAAAAHAGKSVLFVAEKTAALSVVHDRLSRAGLGALCLEMHSRKANKSEVLKSLDEALRLSGTLPADGQISTRLASCRDSLNGWSVSVHRPIGNTRRTPFHVMGRHLQLQADNVRLSSKRLPIVANWSEDQLVASEHAVDRAATALAKFSAPPAQLGWYGTRIKSQSPFDLERLALLLADATTAVDRLSSHVAEIYLNIVGEGEPGLAEAFALVDAFRHLREAPSGRLALANPAWIQEPDKLQSAIAQGERAAVCTSEINSLFHPEAWSVDTPAALATFQTDGRSFFGRLGQRYRRAAAMLRAICRNNVPRSVTDRIALLQKLHTAQQLRREFSGISSYLSAALGPMWQNEENRWREARVLMEWTRVALSKIGAKQTVLLAARTSELDTFGPYADNLERIAGAADEACSRVFDVVDPEPTTVFDNADYRQVPLGALVKMLSNWRSGLPVVNDWVKARDALIELSAKGFTEIASDLASGAMRPSDARPVTDLLVAEALWERARQEDPTLMEIEGTVRSDRVSEFRELDRLRIAAARHDVLCHYLEERPAGYQGEMGIIRAEIGKKRGHRALRKLILDAGAAVQRLKPVFLMSPLSVAQFIPPGKLSFDLLVIDEASQISPEDALGAVARARQIVVVGDHQQLPPTNFFKTVSAGGDDDEADEPSTSAMRPGYYESILTLARTRGMSERMLAWHYRSRHPSLIALSNQECYSGRLLLPPSPFLQTAQFGLSFVATPRGHYDRGGTSRDLVQAEEVAKAVAAQIKAHPNKSLGVACLSAQQRDAVDDMIDKLGLRGEVEAFSPKGERLFVKNLEAVQGDERDIIFISVGYGVAQGQSRPFLNFGPVSRDGGERRLNVLASRAREKCVVFSSITAADIPADSHVRGTRMLRALLHFAETGKLSAGTPDGDFDSPFEDAVARVICQAGYDVHPQVGVSSFRIDLGVLRRSKPGEYLLGVECDGATYHRARSARDRDRLRQEVLEGLGWRLHRIWSTDWFRNQERETQRLLSAIRDAESRADSLSDDGEEEPDETSPSPIASQETAIAEDIPDPLNNAADEYRECSLTVPYRHSLLDLSVGEVGLLALAVVEAEGPVHTEEVARRIREAFGLQKTGSRILKHVRGGLTLNSRSNLVKREQEFWTIPGRQLAKIRTRRSVALSLRRASMISPAEYQLAIVTIIRETVAISPDELGVETARRFGFDRTGPDLKHEINRQISALIKAGQVSSEGGNLQMVAVLGG